MAVYAVLVEFELPDDGPGSDFVTAVAPLLEAIREFSPGKPTVSAFSGEAAERFVKARDDWREGRC